MSVAVVFAGDGSGSGFLISDDGLLLTNQHVVGGSKYVNVKWSDGTESLGEVLRVDRPRDVALVKTDAKGRIPLALRTDTPNQGETVYAIGSPLGHKGMMVAAKSMALTTVDLFTDPAHIQKAKAEFDQKRGPGFVYKTRLADRKPALDYRK